MSGMRHPTGPGFVRGPVLRTASLLPWIGLSLLVTLAPAGAQPAPTPALTLVEAVDRALAAYPSIRIAEAARAETAAGLREVETARRPRFDLRSTANQYQKNTPVSPIHGFTPDAAPPFNRTVFQTVLSGSYLLLDGGERNARVAQARWHADAAGADLASARAVVIARVASSYMRILSHRQVLDAHDRRLAALESERRRVEQLLAVGRAAQLDVLRVSAALAGATADRVRFAEALDLAERELARLIDAEPEDTRADRLRPFELAGSAPPGGAELLMTALDHNPAIAAARLRVAVAGAGVASAESERRPRVSAVGSLIDFGSAAGHFTNEWTAGVVVAYPLFDGGAARERRARAVATRDVAVETLRLREAETADQLDRALSAVREAAARRASLATAVDQFAEVARIERLRLDTGTATQTDFLTAEADLLAARASLVDARYAEQMARVELARVTDELDTDWLRRHIVEAP